MLAVYGTLRAGFHNHYILEDSKYLGTTKTPPAFTLFDNGGYPFLFPEGDQEVVVEIYEVTDERVSKRVNYLEGFTGIRGAKSNYYETVDISTEFGKVEAFVAKTKPNLRVIESGDWSKKNATKCQAT